MLNNTQFILYSTARSRQFCSDISTGYGSLQKLSTMTMYWSKNANAKIKEKFSLKVLLKRVNVNVYSRARIFSEDSKDRAKYIVSIMDSSSEAIRWTTSSVTEGWSLATIISTLPCQKKSQFDLLSSRRGKKFLIFRSKTYVNCKISTCSKIEQVT